jgi:hypothetical protein
MQYFVSAENSSYFYWQLELLIESFLMQGLEKNLIIGLAENESQKIRGFSSNLVKYGNKFMHPNEGSERGYPPVNRALALRHAIAHKALKFPFVLIHADMILRNPVSIGEGEDNYGVIINNYEDFSAGEENSIKEEISPAIKRLCEERSIAEDELPVIPFFSAPVVFNSPFEYISETFFSKLHMNMLDILSKRDSSFPCEKAAWELTLAESSQHCSMKGKFLAAPLMFDDENINFIHYKNGIPPVFHKKFYKYEEGVYFTGQGPYDTIMEHNPTINTNYLHQVIRSYKRRNNK